MLTRLCLSPRGPAAPGARRNGARDKPTKGDEDASETTRLGEAEKTRSARVSLLLALSGGKRWSRVLVVCLCRACARRVREREGRNQCRRRTPTPPDPHRRRARPIPPREPERMLLRVSVGLTEGLGVKSWLEGQMKRVGVLEMARAQGARTGGAPAKSICRHDASLSLSLWGEKTLTRGEKNARARYLARSFSRSRIGGGKRWGRWGGRRSGEKRVLVYGAARPFCTRRARVARQDCGAAAVS